MFFSNSGAFYEAGRELLLSLRTAAIEHVFVGRAALEAHGCPLAAGRLEVCLPPTAFEHFHHSLAGYVFEPLPGQQTRYVHPPTQVEIALLPAGGIVGDGLRQREIRWPQPAQAQFVAGLPVPGLARLIELLLASFEHDDLLLAGRLARRHQLDASFAQRLHPVVRGQFAACLG